MIGVSGELVKWLSQIWKLEFNDIQNFYDIQVLTVSTYKIKLLWNYNFFSTSKNNKEVEKDIFTRHELIKQHLKMSLTITAT